MPKRRYINARYYLLRIYAQQQNITQRQDELIAELADLERQKALLEDRAEALVAYEWQSHHHFPLIEEMASQ